MNNNDYRMGGRGWLFLAAIFGYADAMASFEFKAVDVHLTTSFARYELLTEQEFEMHVSATVHCAFRDISTGLRFYSISEEDLGGPFQLNSNDHYATIRQSGDLLMRTGRYDLRCGEPIHVSARLLAPRESGVHYVSACIPVLRDDKGKVFPGTEVGSWSSCSEPLTLDVRPRPASDLVALQLSVSPVKHEYPVDQAITVDVQVRNIGNGASRATYARLFKSSSDKVERNTGEEIGYEHLRALGPGESATVRFRTTTQAQARSTYYAGCVDGSWRGEAPELPGGYTDVEHKLNNNGD